MKRLPILIAALALAGSSVAEDRVRDAQAILKAQGFYYGEVTGKETVETVAAVRRFQIRKGIPVTGKMDPTTLTAMGLGGKNAVASTPAAPAAPRAAPDPGRAQLNPPPPKTPATPKPGQRAEIARSGRYVPEEDSLTRIRPQSWRNDDGLGIVDPPTAIPSPVFTPFSTMFRGTPYATSPRDVQLDVVRRAQAFLAARRLYRGPIDGLAAVQTSEAIFLFQEDARLRPTGRLDVETLAEMRLLPALPRGNPVLRPFYNPNRQRDRSISYY